MRAVFCGRWNRHSSAYPETKELWRVREAVDHGRAAPQDLRRAEDAATALLLSQLDRLGLDTVSDGGLRWDSLYDIARRIGGCSGFTRLIRIPETNHFHRQPVATLPLRWEGPILLDDLAFARAHTRRSVAVALPGPYSLARQTENYRAVGVARLAEAYAAVLRQEAASLLDAGAAFVKIDDPQILMHPEDAALVRAAAEILTQGLDRSRIGLSTWFEDVSVFPGYFTLPFGVFFLNLAGNGRAIPALRELPADRALALGVVDAYQTYEEQPGELSERVLSVASLRSASSPIVTTNTDLSYLPWERSLEKLRVLVAWARTAYQEGKS
jgi:5-methyltetrahydropteroyltriglutamate--homocysteine methyltransferase